MRKYQPGQMVHVTALVRVETSIEILAHDLEEYDDDDVMIERLFMEEGLYDPNSQKLEEIVRVTN